METENIKNYSIDLSDKLYKIIVGVIVLCAVFMTGQMFYQFQSLPQNSPHEIPVNGEGKAYAKPDVAMINFGAHTQALKSQDAVNQNNQIMNNVISAIKNLGVEDKDIQTTLYNLQPVYEYGVQGQGSGGAIPLIYPYPEGNRVFKGYSLDQQIQVKIRDFDKINDILDAASINGANTIGQLYFAVDDMEKARSEARAKAIARAKEKAGSLFGQSGIRSFKLVSVSEGYQGTIPYGGGYAGVALEKSDVSVPAPSIETGQMEVNAVVTLTYRIK